jgi:hypothetical protein
MNGIDVKQERSLAEEKIKGENFDFTAKYYAVAELRALAEKHPEIFGRRTVSTLEDLMKHTKFARQRQGFFLFRETSNALAALMTHCDNVETAEIVLSSFKRILSSVTEHAHRAAAEALGALPVSVEGPGFPRLRANRIPAASLEQILDGNKTIRSPGKAGFLGRSFVLPCNETDSLLVLKFARPTDTPEALAGEILWMDQLRSADYRFGARFDVPRGVFVDDCPVFRLKHPPPKNGVALHPKRYAIAFVAHRDYYTYPNAPETAKKLSGDAFSKVICQNAFLAGKLASKGVVHSALIPLFHNRVQTRRRRDRGLYEWFRAGRLDQWLRSCDHPNLGVSGLRDFEHLLSYNEKGLALYRYMGSQFLSFLLVAGSYFRNKDREKVGVDDSGKPVDARSLFDRKVLEKTISGMFERYYLGFTGEKFKGDLPFDLRRLATRMIDEMGVDTYMEEILRWADQNQMPDDEFVAFLKNRGFSPERIAQLRRGETDIVIESGPHLGGFNERISLPELIEAVAAMSGVCVAGKFWKEKFRASLKLR